jgi:hypothetical protein
VAWTQYPKRAFLGLALFVGQAFIYNGVTFNLGTLFTTFFGVASGFVPVFIIIWALGNFAGPVTLGRLFDTIGRKPMISGTYIGSALVAAGLAFYLLGGGSSSWVFLGILVVAFFLASSGASAAYLTVSEIFPMETRALAIAFFYAIGTGVGGVAGPLIFSNMISSGNRGQVATAFFIAAAVMAGGGVVEIFFGVKAEQAKLEDLAQPLTSAEAESDERSADEDGRSREGSGNDDDERARRIHERAERRASSASGPGRYRPGPGRGPNSPWVTVPPAGAQDEVLDAEIETIARAVEDQGPIPVEELEEAVAAKYWGPGRFRGALREAIREERVQRVSRGRVGPADGSGSDGGGDG